MANTLFNPTKLYAVLQDLANDVKQGYIDTLLRNDRKASGNLINSVKAEVVVDGTTYIAQLTNLQDYWEYVENGTAPHFPPIEAIAKWIEIKPVIPRPMADGRIPSTKQLAFLIARKISIYGTEGSHDFEKTKDAIIPYYEERLLDALGRDTIEYIEKLLS